MIDEDDENPYYDDTITKYMHRPLLPEFDDLTYPQYFERFTITPSPPASTPRRVYRDQLNNYVVKRSKEIFTRHRFLKIHDGELYFYQKLLYSIPTRCESDLKSGPTGTYREKFLSLFPDFLNELQNQVAITTQSRTTRLNVLFGEMLDRLLSSLRDELPANIHDIIHLQLESLKILPYILPETAMLELPQDQYRTLSTISTYMGRNDGVKWPYYFITGPAGTGKSYIINLLLNLLDQRHSNYLLLAPTGVAAQNVGGMTIHSALHITSTSGGFRTQAYTNRDLNDRLKRVDTIIFEEVSMVSAELLDFTSNLFASLHNNALPFGGVNVIVVGDLAQLPPITGQPVFRATVWALFYPLFLKSPQRQHNDPIFFQMLQEVRMGNISPRTWRILHQRHSEFTNHSTIDTLLNTTHIVGFRETAHQINRMICNMLPVPNNKFLISRSIDFVNSAQWDPASSEQMFKSKTNLPSCVRLQPGARIMFLNNSLMDKGICNGTTGVITDIDLVEQSVRVAFSIRGSLIDIDIHKQTHYFQLHGSNCHRTQFPLLNSFALTIHKTQSSTLLKVSLALDGNIFAPGQAYVALSRCSTWDNVEISHLDPSAFITDQDMILEYQRLHTVSTANPHYL